MTNTTKTSFKVVVTTRQTIGIYLDQVVLAGLYSYPKTDKGTNQKIPSKCNLRVSLIIPKKCPSLKPL